MARFSLSQIKICSMTFKHSIWKQTTFNKPTFRFPFINRMQTCYFELINPAVFVLKNVNCYWEYSLANSPLLYWYWDKNRVVGKTEPMLNSTFLLSSTPSLFLYSTNWILKRMKGKGKETSVFVHMYIPLLSHPWPGVNVTMLHLCPVLSIGRLIITQRGGWGSFGGASALVMPAFKTIYCPDIFMTMILGDSWPEDFIQQPDDHVMLAESKLMTRRWSWAGQSSSVSPEFWMIERSGKACQLKAFSLVFISGDDQYSL